MEALSGLGEGSGSSYSLPETPGHPPAWVVDSAREATHYQRLLGPGVRVGVETCFLWESLLHIRTSPSKGKRNFAGALAKREPVQSSCSGAGSCTPAPGYSTRPQGNLDHEVPNLVHPQKYHFLCCLSSRLPLLHQVAGLYWGRIQGTGCYTARSARLHCSAHHPLPAALVKLPWPTGQVNTPGI